MARKKRDNRPGYGKLLDAWVAPDAAGDPIGCVATSFTFSPAFFEEECLARFLQLESDPNEDGPVYLVEREEKLAQIACAAALVDQHHCRGSRSLRWDLLAARMPRGILHAKVSLLYWANYLRVIVGSANLTNDGYRRNQEVFGVVDYYPSCESPRRLLSTLLEFMRAAGAYSAVRPERSPALTRWNGFLDRVVLETTDWGRPDDELRRSDVKAAAIVCGPGRPNVFEQLQQVWPAESPPTQGSVVSPFFDRPEISNAPAETLWSILRQRGQAEAHFHVAAEEVPGEDSMLLLAPKSLLEAQPSGRQSTTTRFFRIQLPGSRPLHAKAIRLRDSRWKLYMVGSSNFTSAGTGLSKDANLEANIAYLADSRQNAKSAKSLDEAFPDSEVVDLARGVQWKPLTGEGEDSIAEELRLPAQFGDGIYHVDERKRAVVTLDIEGNPPKGWRLYTDGDEDAVLIEEEWLDQGSPDTINLAWTQARPPSGFWVRWSESAGSAWWPINVTSGQVLAPPQELKDLPLEVLIEILSSARPLHRVMKAFLRRQQRRQTDNANGPLIDPHKRVDTSQFLLRRTRRMSWALGALKERLERPAVTLEFLQWRLRGPVGVMALATALVREAQSDEEKAFLISELALELSRVNPPESSDCINPATHKAEIQKVIAELRALVPPVHTDEADNLRQYVESVFAAVDA